MRIYIYIYTKIKRRPTKKRCTNNFDPFGWGSANKITGGLQWLIYDKIDPAKREFVFSGHNREQMKTKILKKRQFKLKLLLIKWKHITEFSMQILITRVQMKTNADPPYCLHIKITFVETMLLCSRFIRRGEANEYSFSIMMKKIVF